VDVRDLNALTLMDNFKNAVMSERLPLKYLKDQRDNRADYENFFNNWGHYIVTTAFGGGSVELKSKSFSTTNSAESFLTARMEIQSTFHNISAGIDMKYRNSETSGHHSQLKTSHLKWNGGDSKYQAENVSNANPEMWKKWESSLATSPAVLTTKMSLTPISEVVNLIAPAKTNGCRDALFDLLGGKFTLFVKKEEENQRLSEEKVKKQQELSMMIEETNRKKIAESTKTSSSDCFPGTSFVWVRNKEEPVLLQELGIGEEVLCLNNNKMELIYSPVFMFAHKNNSKMTTYLKIYTDSNSCISVSPKHLLQTQKKGKQDPEFTFADHCAVGDSLFTSLKNEDNSFTMVKSIIIQIEEVTLEGLYAPFTLAGTIIVDNIAASCYANIQDISLFGLTHISCQTLAHGFVAPLRAAHNLGNSQFMDIPTGKDMPVCIEKMFDFFKPFLVI